MLQNVKTGSRPKFWCVILYCVFFCLTFPDQFCSFWNHLFFQIINVRDVDVATEKIGNEQRLLTFWFDINCRFYVRKWQQILEATKSLWNSKESLEEFIYFWVFSGLITQLGFIRFKTKQWSCTDSGLIQAGWQPIKPQCFVGTWRLLGATGWRKGRPLHIWKLVTVLNTC